MHKLLTDHYRCADTPTELSLSGCLSAQPGFFSFGPDIVCYGRTCRCIGSKSPSCQLHDVLSDVRSSDFVVQLPFDPLEVIDNLRHERYVSSFGNGNGRRIERVIRDAYYLVRPLLPVGVRKHLQRAHLNGWRRLSFPRWPVDVTVDSLLEKLLALSTQSEQTKPVPFIWFWPDGAAASAIMTHDVETEKGVQLSTYIMDVNESFRIPASFQIVPEQRYRVTSKYLSSLRDRGCEVNVQDLNHDGNLFRDWAEFKRRVTKVNWYGREFGASGFRSAVLYRNQEWYDLLEFEYDMSVPNVGHLDPQRGGCCTVMPYFVGKILELPVTMTQDYSLFHILNDYSLNLWRQQVGLILKRYGLISMIVHPDYLDGHRATKVYKELLSFLAELRQSQNVWVALPGEVNRWWRERSAMKLICQNGEWRVEGPGSERAHVAFARLEGDRLRYSIQPPRLSENSARSKS